MVRCLWNCVCQSLHCLNTKTSGTNTSPDNTRPPSCCDAGAALLTTVSKYSLAFSPAPHFCCAGSKPCSACAGSASLLGPRLLTTRRIQRLASYHNPPSRASGSAALLPLALLTVLSRGASPARNQLLRACRACLVTSSSVPRAVQGASPALLALAALAVLLSAFSIFSGRRAARRASSRRRDGVHPSDVAAAAGALIALGVLATLLLGRGRGAGAAPVKADGESFTGGEADAADKDITVCRGLGNLS